MRKWKIYIALAWGLAWHATWAQSQPQEAKKLSLIDAISLAFEHNFSIQLAKNEAEIAHRQNTPGNAGMLPVVELNLNRSFTNINIQQQLASGLNVNRSGAASNTLNAQLGIRWNLFDGMRMFTSRQRLAELENMGRLNLTKAMQQVVLSTADNYYKLVALERMIEFLKSMLTASEERVKLAAVRFETGMAPKTEWLQAKIDYNEQLNALQEAKTSQQQLQLQLLNTIAPGKSFAIITTDSIDVENSFDYKAYQEKIAEANIDILLARQNLIISKLAKKDLVGRQLPTISIEPGYNFVRNRNEAGFLLANQTYGPVLGFGIHIPIFNGYELGNALKIADLEAEKAKLQTEALYQSQLTSFQTLMEAHKNALLRIKLQLESVQLSKELDKINYERLQLNQITAVEYRMAQAALMQSMAALYQLLYDAKMAEISMILLGGEPVYKAASAP